MSAKVDLTGKVAVVTGGGGILCSTMAKALAGCGAKVAILDLKQESAQKVADEITAAGGAVSVTQSDCPGQDCVHSGAVSRAGQSIVCLPARVAVTLEGAASDYDLIAG